MKLILTIIVQHTYAFKLSYSNKETCATNYLFATIQSPPTFHIHGPASSCHPAEGQACQLGDQAGLGLQPRTEGE